MKHIITRDKIINISCILENLELITTNKRRRIIKKYDKKYEQSGRER